MASLSTDEAVWAQLDTSRPDDWSAGSAVRKHDDGSVEVLADNGERAILPAERVAARNGNEQDRVPDLAQLVHLSEP